MQFQCECFITSNLSGEDPWRLRCQIEYMSVDVPNWYMYLDVPKLDVHKSALFCCPLRNLWEQRMGTSARLKLYSRKLCSSVILIFEFSAEFVFCFRSDAGQNLLLLWVWYEVVLWRMLQRLIQVWHSHIRLLLIGRSDSVAIQIEYWCILCVAFKELALNMHPGRTWSICALKTEWNSLLCGVDDGELLGEYMSLKWWYVPRYPKNWWSKCNFNVNGYS
jgi:hypothetical protein